jgi:hypothetical protein
MLATGVVVTDRLASSTTLVTLASSQGSCSGTTTVTCQLGSLSPGAVAIVTIVVRPTTPGTVVNVATATSEQPDADPSDNTGVATVVVQGPFAPPASCDSVAASPTSLTIGRRTAMRVVVRAGGTPLAGATVRVAGAGIGARATTNARGVARVSVLARQPGVVRITVAGEACQRRIGALGAFQPPLTG